MLRYMHASQEKELVYRRTRELQIFKWSNAILLSISGLLLSSYSQNKENAYNVLIYLRIIITFFIFSLTFFSIKWQLYQRQRAANHQKIVTNLAIKLGCFDGNNPIFPKKWKNWGHQYTTFREFINFPSKILATLFLALMAFLSCWLDLLVR